jgi:hypothetical protein
MAEQSQTLKELQAVSEAREEIREKEVKSTDDLGVEKEIDQHDESLNPEGKPYIAHNTLLSELGGAVSDFQGETAASESLEQLRKMASGDIPQDPSAIEGALQFLDEFEEEQKEVAEVQEKSKVEAPTEDFSADNMRELAKAATRPYEKAAFERLAGLLEGGTKIEDYDQAQLDNDLEALGLFAVDENSSVGRQPEGLENDTAARGYYEFTHRQLGRMAGQLRQELEAKKPDELLKIFLPII